jgi:hypothetical protein
MVVHACHASYGVKRKIRGRPKEKTLDTISKITKAKWSECVAQKSRAPGEK